MEYITTGILAHVDAGKTTLSEAFLYHAGVIRTRGRVDHRDTFLDTEPLERQRGITIVSKQAVMEYGGMHLTLLDTPGHVDFGAETERTLSVLDVAILVISGQDGIQSHTETLWEMLQEAGVPVFLFINKMDLAHRSREELMDELRERFGDGCVAFDEPDPEQLALCSEPLMNAFLEGRPLPEQEIRHAIAQREMFPCWFGSALKLEGTEAFLNTFTHWALPFRGAMAFGARVFKISRDAQGNRLTHMKLTGGHLRVRDVIAGEKVNEIRVYHGTQYEILEQADAGMVCQVRGLSRVRAGDGLGCEQDAAAENRMEPVLRYQVVLKPGQDPHRVLECFRELEEEEPTLQVQWEEEQQDIFLRIMGQVQLEVLTALMRERFGEPVSFGEGRILYRETIREKVEGVGHFEPLRHYAEVHLVMEPGPRGSGLVLENKCSEEELARNWQRLILTVLETEDHPGILTGSPLTDIKITLTAGRAHQKHSNGEDFRQAACRAVRQGLMEAGCVLLEPWVAFRIRVPADQTGRLLSEIQHRGGRFDPLETEGNHALLRGRAPVRRLHGYREELSCETHGRSRMSVMFGGYEECEDADQVVENIRYRPEQDTAHPSGSIFCRHGAGVAVPWDQVKEHMHIDSTLSHAVSANLNRIDPGESDAIFAAASGSGKRKPHIAPRVHGTEPKPQKLYQGKEKPAGSEYLLVDGYNLIFAWEELKQLAKKDFGGARERLIEILSNYHGYRGGHLILAFDAYQVKKNPGSVERISGIDVVYTKEAETADMYIGKVTRHMGRNHRVRVVSSDGMVQLIILGHGAVRTSSAAFIREIQAVEEEIAQFAGK